MRTWSSIFLSEMFKVLLWSIQWLCLDPKKTRNASKLCYEMTWLKITFFSICRYSTCLWLVALALSMWLQSDHQSNFVIPVTEMIRSAFVTSIRCRFLAHFYMLKLIWRKVKPIIWYFTFLFDHILVLGMQLEPSQNLGAFNWSICILNGLLMKYL